MPSDNWLVQIPVQEILSALRTMRAVRERTTFIGDFHADLDRDISALERRISLHAPDLEGSGE